MKKPHPFAIKNAPLVRGLHICLGHAKRHPVFIVPVIGVHLFDKARSVFGGSVRGWFIHLDLLFSMFGHIAPACKLDKSPSVVHTPIQASGQIARVA